MSIEVAEQIAECWLRSIYIAVFISFTAGALLGYFFRKETEDKMNLRVDESD